MAIEIVDLPIKHGGSFHSFLYVCQRGNKIANLTSMKDLFIAFCFWRIPKIGMGFWGMFQAEYCRQTTFILLRIEVQHTVDGCEILHQLVDGISHYLQGFNMFNHPRWCRILQPSTVCNIPLSNCLATIVIKGSLGGETSVLRTFRMSGKELVKERVSQGKVS